MIECVYNKQIKTLCEKSGERFEALLRFRFRRVGILGGIRVSDCVGTKNKNLAFSKVQTEIFMSFQVLIVSAASHVKDFTEERILGVLLMA